MFILFNYSFELYFKHYRKTLERSELLLYYCGRVVSQRRALDLTLHKISSIRRS